jgi:hypothetical protein
MAGNFDYSLDFAAVDRFFLIAPDGSPTAQELFALIGR